MTGTFLNIATVLIGGVIGLIFGARIPDKLKATVIAGMGLFTAAMGLQMFLKTENPLIVLGALLIGTLLGEWWRIDCPDGSTDSCWMTAKSRYTRASVHAGG